ncbi:uncharacterized protein LOC107265566 isoform X2 [Cephus cinctus]|uniref:Uncharacterized protein LOC107265566 isoform X2 n=1 Tax=Cephus cinctus TaxID=211228 RepID=A0AAJ7BNN8_CEPCN|nr:uncharacterized protein LOC107265566 isoform X2 [Cephus cinctus]
MRAVADGMEEPQKLFRLPGTIEEEEERELETQVNSENQPGPESPLLTQKVPSIVTGFPRNVTLVRVSTQSSSIGGGVGRQDSNRSRYRAGPVKKIRRRVVLKNGECNVLQSRISRRSLRFLQDIFTTLVDTQWRWTLLCFTLSFFLSWLGFAVIWWLIVFTHGDLEKDHLPSVQVENNWTPCVININSFTSCFLFSIETQHTIGYGSRTTTEECPEAIFVMCIQSIAGVMIQAFMVGIVFAKMTRPKQRTQTLLFSRNAVICQRDGELCLMFRVGDMRKSHIIGATVRAQVIRSRTTKEGEFLSQHQQELAIGTDGDNGNLFFIWPTTIVHNINADSPFYNMSAEDMLTERFEVVVILEGTIESTGQTTQARSSYLPQEILWGHRFEPMVGYSKERQGYEVDYSLFNSTTQVDTPLCSGRELAEFYRVQDDLRHGPGFIVDDDGATVDPYPDMYTQYMGHHPPRSSGHHPLVHAESTKSAASDISLEDSTIGRSLYRDDSLGPQMPNRETGTSRIIDLDPDAIQVIGEAELYQLPEAVNKEILKNSREIVFEEQEMDSLPEAVNPKRPMGYPGSIDDKRSLNGSKNLSFRTLGLDDEKRSLNGSRRNLNGSRRYHVLLDHGDSFSSSARNLFHVGSRENLGPRRHTGSKEGLNVIRKTVRGMKGSKETPELRSRRRLPDISQGNQTEVGVDVERVPKQDNPSNYTSPSSSVLTESGRSPESGFVDQTQYSSPESIKRGPRLPQNSVIARNRRSYENAQLQDMHEALTRTISESSSSDSESTTKNVVASISVPNKHIVTINFKSNSKPMSYTSV